MRKWVSYLIDGVMGAFIAALLACQITMMVTAKDNYGVPSLFGYSFMQVLTDSMAGSDDPSETLSDGTVIVKKGPLSLAKGTGIIIDKADPSSIEVGEAISFYSVDLGAPVTHRVIEIGSEQDGSLIFYTFGDNPESETCSSWVNGGVACSYPANRDVVEERYLIGRVVSHSDAFGAFLGVVQSTWFVPIAVLCPLTVIAILSVADFVKESKAEKKEEEEAIAKELAAAGIDPKDEKAVLLFQEKARYRHEVEQAVAEAAAKEKKTLAKQIAKEKKRAMRELREEMRKEAKGDGTEKK